MSINTVNRGKGDPFISTATLNTDFATTKLVNWEGLLMKMACVSCKANKN
jgi:hypothetical protein